MCLYYAFSFPAGMLKAGGAVLLFGGLSLSVIGKVRVRRSGAWAVLALAVLQFIPAMMERSRIGLEYLPQRERDWHAVQFWAMAHTPERAVFFTPMQLQGFRVFSRRSSVCEWLDGAAMHWAPGFEKNWLARLRDVYLLTGGKGAGPQKMDASRRALFFRALSGKYGASYVVDEGQDELPFPLLYSAGGFRVYKIPNAHGL